MKKMTYLSNGEVVYACEYHVVFCPKYKRKVLVGDIHEECQKLIMEICKNLHIDLLQMDISPDQVELLLEVDPQLGIHKAIKAIKRKTSRELRHKFPELTTRLPTLWTNSYMVTTVGKVSQKPIDAYLASQKISQRHS